MEVKRHLLAVLLCIYVKSAACQAPTAGPSEAPATSSQSPSHALAAAAAPSDVTQMLNCEMRVLNALGWQQAYNSNSYSDKAQLPANCNVGIWQSLGCLQSLTNLTVEGTLSHLQLPDS